MPARNSRPFLTPNNSAPSHVGISVSSTEPAPREFHPLSLYDAVPISNVGAALDEYGTGVYTSADLGIWTASTTGSKDFEFAATGLNARRSGNTPPLHYIRLTPSTAPTTHTTTASASTGSPIGTSCRCA